MKWSEKIINDGNKIINSLDFTNVTPQKSDVLNFLKLDLEKIKVVIIGQDPYPTPGIANGYAFAVKRGTKIPKSLQNIFKEIEEVQGFVKADCTLDHWTRQGVLLLNASLTTKVFEPNSHKHIWSAYISEVINFIDVSLPNAVWVVWGRWAESVTQNVSGRKIIDAHPSPLSFRLRSKITFKTLKDIEW